MNAIRRTNHIFCSLLALACGAGLASCGGEEDGGSSSRGNSVVYEGGGSVQCGQPGITPQQSAQKLINGGLDVLRSGCGAVTGVAYPAVCGAADGKILLHEIRAENLSDAERLGFGPVAALRNSSGRGYEWVDCQTRAIIN